MIMATAPALHSSEIEYTEKDVPVAQSVELAYEFGDWIPAAGRGFGPEWECEPGLCLLHADGSSVRSEGDYEPAEATSWSDREFITDEEIWSASVDHDIISRPSPRRSYTVHTTITEVRRGKPRPAEPSWMLETTRDE